MDDSGTNFDDYYQSFDSPVYQPPAPVTPTPTMQDNVNTWFQQNPNATPTDVLQAIQSAGGMTSDIAAAVGAHYGTDAGAVQTYYTDNSSPPVAQPEAIKEAPVAPTPTVYNPPEPYQPRIHSLVL